MLTQEVATGQTSIPLRGLRIDKFYGHDDQFGPFGRLEIGPSVKVGTTEYPVSFKGSWTDPVGNKLNLYPNVIVVPVYHKIRLTFFLDAAQWLTRLHVLIEHILSKRVPPPDIEWDAHLITTNQYKDRVKGTGLQKPRLEGLLLLQHPRFIWYAGLSVQRRPCLGVTGGCYGHGTTPLPVYKVIWRDAVLHAEFSTILNAPAHHAVLTVCLPLDSLSS